MKLPFIGMILIFLLTVACAKAPAIKSGAEPLPNLSAYRTYQCLQDMPQAHIDVVADDELDRLIRNTIAFQLENRGLKEAAENPDLLVTYRTTLRRTFSDMPRTRGKAEFQATAPWTATSPDPEGSLSIDMIEPVTHKLLWRGTARAVVWDIRDARVKVPEAVRTLLSY